MASQVRKVLRNSWLIAQPRIKLVFRYGTTYESEADMQTPQEKHPIFYGCFDWHSSVHGHWLMASAANRFPGSELAGKIEEIFDKQFQVSLINVCY